jgi:dipeptidyl aminopeptidase/acylaminoacyl peptidase
VRFIRHHADRFGIDRDRIGAIGSSSGGGLTLHLATSAPGRDPLAADPIETESSRVQAVVACFSPTELVNFGSSSKTIQDHLKVNAPFDFRKWDDKTGIFVKVTDPEERRVIFEGCSPITHVGKDDPPMLLLHGDQDEKVRIQQSKRFLQRMQDAGAVCKLIEIPGMGHGWDPLAEGELEAVTGWFDRWLLKERGR